ncbi:MAM domain-containing glycosylphosphatidylinositol anchor protein 2-like [Oncorhynchus masou masou]|uniref:MAM domain-containing glycosylphosphatidylinositol anchor protein 2-like n=1 Tax=Oncorhynchus masou masou TaxID=90313 RepID=UPI003182DDC7
MRNTLDHCYSNFHDAYKALPSPPFDKSDHDAILLLPSYRQKLKQDVPVMRTIKRWSDQSEAMLQDCFDHADWNMFQSASENDIVRYADSETGRMATYGKAYPPEFYYDTYSPLWQNRPRVYGFKLQWTQMNPNSVDRIVAYRLGIRQMGQQRWWEQEITVEGTITKGELITHNLTELIKPEAYEVRLTPITRFGEGDSTIRIITYSAPVNPHLREFHCSFEEEPICMFTQDKNDDFDWTRHSAATRDTKYTPNTGPSGDRSGSKQGFYMYIETSRPRKEGEVARLVSPFFNVAPKNPYGITNPPAYCFGFFFHMYGKHIVSPMKPAEKGFAVKSSKVSPFAV